MVKPNWILQRTRLSHDKMALIDLHTKQSWTYASLEEEMLKWIAFIQQQGLKRGERMVVLSANRMELFPILFASGMMGIIYVPLNYRLSIKEQNELMKDAGASLLLYDEGYEHIAAQTAIDTKINIHSVTAQPIESIRETTVEPHDPWLIIYTGGTTGKPKGVVLSHESVNENAINTITSWSLSEEDTTINYMPLFHTGGINALCLPLLMTGGTVVIGSEFDAEEALRATNEFAATISLFVPTMYHLMTQTDYFKQAQFDSMRVFLSGGAPCPPSIYTRFHEKNLDFKEGYGLTEAGPNNFFIRPEQAKDKLGSVGKSMLFNEVLVVSDDGKPCRTNEVGELWLKGKHVFSEYWNLEQETKEAFYEGWLKTGDLAKYDEDGDYYIVGRKKDMIISGGENIYPQEIEQCLMCHDAISEAAVIGVPEQKWGEMVIAFITLYPNEVFNEREFIEHCQAYLGNYKIPKQFIVIDDMPKTDVGKVNKNKLLQLMPKS